jgi:transcriptional regulator with XRE-family HTH domain
MCIERISEEEEVKNICNAIRLIRRSANISLNDVKRRMDQWTITDISKTEHGKMGPRKARLLLILVTKIAAEDGIWFE